MKAVVYEEYAPDDDYKKILKVKDVEEPKPKSNEVVFEVKAAALNYNDIWGMRGVPIPVPLPHISGSDAAGEVINVGEDVTGINVGDRVVSHSNMSCRVCSDCTDGREYDCGKRGIWGFQTGPLWGGFSEITHLPEVNVIKIPVNVSFDEAAAASMTLLTSWLQTDDALTPELLHQQRTRLFWMAGAFFLLFYTFPAGMVLYWTTNNVLALVRSVPGAVKSA